MSEFSGIIDNVIQMPKQSALSSAVTSIDDDPEQASRAIKLGDASGADPSAVYADVEGFDRQFKGNLTSQIINGNQHLQDYINSHPMASKVSNDDWAQLDVVSQHLKPFGDLTLSGTMKNLAKGFSEGVGPGGIGQWLRSQPGMEDFGDRYPYSAAAWYALGAPIEVPLRLFSGGMHAGAEAVSGWIAGFADVAGAGEEGLKEKAKQSILTTADMYFAGKMSGNIHPTPGVREIKAHNEGLQKAVVKAFGENLDEIEAAIKPYIEAGEPIPVGLHPDIDRIKVEQAKLDMKGLDEAMKESQASGTRERAPELFQNFIKQHTDAKIGISADAIRKLYENKEPLADDNILGWVPDLADRLREAEATGGDVDIPLSDWLARVDPGIAKELHDDTRVRPGGVTINEGKEIGAQKSEKIEEIIGASIKVGDRDYTDITHGHAFDKAAKDIGHENFDFVDGLFKTSEGRLVEREEAGKIAFDAGQIDFPNDLNAEDIKFKEPVKTLAQEEGGKTGPVTDFEEKLLRRQLQEQADKDLLKTAQKHLIEDDGLIEESVNQYKEPSEPSNINKPQKKIEVKKDNVVQLFDSVRTQAALKPLFQEGPIEQLRLRKVKFKSELAGDVGHTFAITDEKGRSVGQLLLNERQEGKDLYVEWVGGANHITGPEGEVSNVFGPKLVRQLIEQLKTEFPNAEFISGHRISGAREKAGTEQTKGMVRVPIKSLRDEFGDVVPLTKEEIANLIEIFQEGAGKWESLGANEKVLLPTDKWTENEQKIIDSVQDVLDRIAPNKVEYQPARAVEMKGRDVRGLHLQYEEALPIIAFSIKDADPIGVAKHEAIHQLRQYRFFDDKEWQILEDAALNNEWIEKHNIDRRYHGSKLIEKIEESIAEEFSEWDREAKSDHPVAKIFQKLKDLLDQIRQAIKGALGYEPTWQDLFKKAESGEIGRREGGEPLEPGAFRASEKEPEKLTKDYIKNIASEKTPIPTTEELKSLLRQVQQAELDYEASLGMTPEVSRKLRALNREIDEVGGARADEAMREKNELVKDIKESEGEPDFPSIDDLKQLRIEFENLERFGDESVQDYMDGVSRVLKRYLGQFLDHDPFANVVFKKAFLEAQKNGIGPKVLSAEVSQRYMSELSLSDQQFMKEEFSRFSRSKVTKASAQEQLQLPGLTRQEDLDLFAKARDIGMNAKQYKRYQELIEQRDAEDIEAQLKRALKIEERKQTKEWKENKVRVRDEVRTDIEQRPDISTARYFFEGKLYDEKLPNRPKLNSDRLTKEQREALSDSLLSEHGVDPADVAGLFGYRSGAEMVDRLVESVKKKEGIGLTKYVEREIEAETQKRMEKQYGDLDQNILSEARDHVLGTTQMDLLHEETVALGMKSGSQMPFGKKDIQSWVRDEFAKATASSVKLGKYLESAGRAGRLAELALLEDNPAEAFRQKQRQYFSALLAREAKKFEKEQAQFDRLAKRFQKREVAGVEQEFTNFIHDLMQKAEVPVRRSAEDIAHEIEKSGYKDIDDFIASKAGQGWELDAPDDILAGKVKPVEKMTVQEFRDYKDVLTNLAHVGREVSKIEIAGKKQDFAEWKSEVLANITELPIRTKEKQRSILYGFDAELTRMEEIIKDLDLRRELGPLYNAMIRPMMEGKHKEFQLQEKLVQRLTGLKEGNKEWRKTLNDSIPQEFFIEPDTGIPFDLNREQMINIMLNFGNKSNTEKFTQGWFGKDGAKAAERQFLDLFEKHATEQDFEFVRKISDIFKDWKEDADNMYRNLSGIAPKWLDIGEDGWYFPVIYDRYYSDINSIVEKKDSNALFGGNYFRATTTNGYTKARTGYIDRVEFQNSLEQLASRMQQTMHDISYRPAVMQASKIIYDPQIKAAIRKHYGMEYEAQLDPWLKSIANQYSFAEREISQTNAMMRRVRMNLVVNALGLNLKQILSPDVGVLTPTSIWRTMKFLDDDTKFAKENSREIPHTLKVMDRDFRESLDRTIATHGMEGMQATAARWAFTPMAWWSQRFRIATWTQKYKDAIGRGLGKADAIEVADSFVRERHGATGLPDMPAIMRGSETRKLITLFYGFGNATYNWQRQIPGALRKGDWGTAMAAAYGAVLIPSVFGIALYNSRKEDDSWFKIIAKGLALQMGQTVAHARDILNYALEDQSPRSPIASAALALKSAATDAWKYYQNKQINKPIQHTANVVGIALGLPGAQIGRIGQFASDVARGKQRPKGFQEYLRGIIHGEAKLRK